MSRGVLLSVLGWLWAFIAWLGSLMGLGQGRSNTEVTQTSADSQGQRRRRQGDGGSPQQAQEQQQEPQAVSQGNGVAGVQPEDSAEHSQSLAAQNKETATVAVVNEGGGASPEQGEHCKGVAEQESSESKER